MTVEERGLTLAWTRAMGAHRRDIEMKLRCGHLYSAFEAEKFACGDKARAARAEKNMIRDTILLLGQ